MWISIFLNFTHTYTKTLSFYWTHRFSFLLCLYLFLLNSQNVVSSLFSLLSSTLPCVLLIKTQVLLLKKHNSNLKCEKVLWEANRWYCNKHNFSRMQMSYIIFTSLPLSFRSCHAFKISSWLTNPYKRLFQPLPGAHFCKCRRQFCKFCKLQWDACTIIYCSWIN